MGRRVKPVRYIAAALAGLVALDLVYPFVWVITPVSGRVVDRATGAPIPNAAVAVSWALQSWEGSVTGFLHLDETTTDAQGEFHLPVRAVRFHFAQGRLSRTQPEIRVIAAGHVPVAARSSNDMTSAFLFAGTGRHGQVFRLDPAIPGETYQRAVEDFDNYFRFLCAERPCERTRIARTLERVSRAREGLAGPGHGSGLPADAQGRP
jgi:hypothetical protein